MGNGHLTSVGIDIGTTTTHLVFSKLLLANTSAATRIPKLEIRARELTYKSRIHFTPLNEDRSINAQGVLDILEQEYKAAGMAASEIDCGAVIITGETALLRNAPQVLAAVSSLAGDFVSASAGPNLESILAARGSGAVEASRVENKTVMNIDIGGGTTNAAVYRDGELIDTACLRLGGRCVRIGADGRVEGVTEGAALVLEGAVGEEKSNKEFSEKELSTLGELIAAAIVDFVSSRERQAVLSKLVMSGPLQLNYEVDEYWLSGGVAAFIDAACDDKLAFGDIGPFVADGLRKVLSERKMNYKIPASPIHATVIGASSHSVQLSGNTITIAPESLPVKNVPLLRPFHALQSEEISAAVASEMLSTCLRNFDLNGHSGPVAVVIDEIKNPRYALLEQWSEAVSSALIHANVEPPYIVIVSTDAAMALGQLMRKHIDAKKLIVVDGLDCSAGDFIEIGRPIGNGLALPVTVKTLLFETSTEERI